MTGNQTHNLQHLKQYFAQQVINQARLVLVQWQNLHNAQVLWSAQEQLSMQDAVQRLLNCAKRVEQSTYVHIAQRLLDVLRAIEDNGSRLSSMTIERITQLLQELLQTGLRQGEPIDQVFLPRMLRQPIYIALRCIDQAEELAEQLSSLSFDTEVFTDAAELILMFAQRQPAVVIIDVDFIAPRYGVELAAQLRHQQQGHIPLFFFYSQTDVGMAVQLAAIRAGGQAFASGALDIASVLSRIDEWTTVAHTEPYRVLLIDNCPVQASITEQMLNAAGIITRVIHQPAQTLTQLLDCDPDLVILDLYQAECSGLELAQVIGQHNRFVGLPIIYLSSENDVDKQLNALSEGADNFLIKPIQAHHLITIVRHRIARARHLKSRLVCDSLTGLFNHTHILQLLDDKRSRAQKNQQPLSFVMLDIDHFKQVNDVYGHVMGDKVIQGLALFLKQRLRRTDAIGRYGGEEFAVILPNTNAQAAAKVINDIRQRFAEIGFAAQQGEVICTFSAGIVEYDGQADSTDLVLLADQALYACKHAGRNCVKVYQTQH
ncbi:MAG TPA: diguanylate cyclase [Thiopseudomonas sp.]|nr:diguanylate cyclase [Thiopseudomonas sp.]